MHVSNGLHRTHILVLVLFVLYSTRVMWVTAERSEDYFDALAVPNGQHVFGLVVVWIVRRERGEYKTWHRHITGAVD